MRKLDRYLFTEVALPFLAAQCIFVVVFMGTEALSEATKLIARFGLPWWSVIKLLLLRMPWALAWTMPMSVGMAVIMALGRLVKDQEYVATVVGGISFERILIPMLVFATLVTAAALYVQEYAGPGCMMAYHVNKIRLQSESKADLLEVHYRLTKYENKERITLTAEQLDTQNKRLRTVEVTVTEQGRTKYEVKAERGEWLEREREWVLFDGRWSMYQGDDTVDGTFARSTITDLARQAGYTGTIVFESSPNEVAVYGTDKPDYLIGPLIRERIRWMKEQDFTRREINRVVIYLHRRYALGTSCFLFLLVGAPLAVKPQRGASKGGSFAVAIALIGAYYITWQSTSLLGEGSRWPLLWAWSTNLLGLAVGLVLWRRVPD